jgi:methionyl-tRNA formyltransferase
MTLRVGFAGTPAFAATALGQIVDAGFSVPLVLTRPDKPKGRGQHLDVTPVKSAALARGLAVHQPATLRDADAVARLARTSLDVLVVAAYGLILPPDVLEWPRAGCLNIHASLLPRWRGAAPIQRAIEAGDRSTGISIMRMDAGLDTGPVVAMHEIAIHPRETGGSLQDKLAALGASAIVQALHALDRQGRLDAVPQPASGATYAHKLVRDEARIDWNQDAVTLDRRIRAFDPEPGAYTTLAGDRLKIRAAIGLDGARAVPGTIIAAGAGGIDVACGAGLLRIVQVQPAGSRAMPVAAYLSGRRIDAGMRFGESPAPAT